MLKVQLLRAGQEHLFAEPLLPAVELRVRCEGSVRDHGEQRELERLLCSLPLLAAGEHGVELEFLPQLAEYVDAAVGPGISDAEIAGTNALDWCRDILAENAEDASRQPTEHGPVHLIRPAEVVDDLGDGAPLLRVPDVLGELVIAYLGTVGVAALRRA